MSDTKIKMEVKTKKQEQQKILKETIKYFSLHKLGDNPNDKAFLQQKIEEFYKLKNEIINCENNVSGKEYEVKPVFDPKNKVNSTSNETPPAGEYKIENNGEKVVEFTTEKLFEGLDSSDKKERMVALTGAFMVVDHELDHYEQDLVIDKAEPSTRSMDLTKDKLLLDYEKFYKTNYWDYRMEDEAYKKSAGNIHELIFGTERKNGTSNIDDISKIDGIDNINEMSDIKKFTENYEKFYDAHYEIGKYKYVSEGDRDEITQQLLDNILCRNKVPNYRDKIINKVKSGDCKAIEYEYNLQENRRKTVDELVEQMEALTNNIPSSSPNREDQVEDIQNMHYEMIYRTMKTTTAEQMKAVEQKLGKDKLESVYDNLKNYFEQKKENCVNKLNQKVDSLKELKSQGITFPEELEKACIEGNYDKYQQVEEHSINKYYQRKLENIENLENGKNMTAGLDSDFKTDKLFDPEEQESAIEKKEFEDSDKDLAKESKGKNKKAKTNKPVVVNNKGGFLSTIKGFVGGVFDSIIRTLSGNQSYIYDSVRNSFRKDRGIGINNEFLNNQNLYNKNNLREELKVTQEQLREVEKEKEKYKRLNKEISDKDNER